VNLLLENSAKLRCKLSEFECALTEIISYEGELQQIYVHIGMFILPVSLNIVLDQIGLRLLAVPLFAGLHIHTAFEVYM